MEKNLHARQGEMFYISHIYTKIMDGKILGLFLFVCAALGCDTGRSVRRNEMLELDARF
jgi:hypothetical protein